MPHVEQLARLLHNRIVRRVRHSHPSADTMLLVGDLVDGHVNLHPVGVWDGAGTTVAGGGAAWRLLVADLRPEFALLARVAPVALFEPYLLDLRQIDVRTEVGDTQ